MTKKTSGKETIIKDKILEEAFSGSVLCAWLDELPELSSSPEAGTTYYGSFSSHPFRKKAFDTVATIVGAFEKDADSIKGLLKKYLLLVSESSKKPAGKAVDGMRFLKSGKFGKKSWFLYEKNKMTGLGIENVSLIVYDFDGVMTDNRVIVDQNGKESVMANRSDGLGVGHIRKMGIRQLIISTEKNPVVGTRAEKLKMEVIQACGDKKKALADYCKKHKIALDETIFVGNDLNDVEVMMTAGFSVAPSDAWPEAKEAADYVTETKGGHGVIRELAELLN